MHDTDRELLMRAPTERSVRLTAQLYRCRDTARTLLGDHYHRDMALWATAIKGVAASDKSSEMAAAIKMAGDSGGFGAITVLAAYVEMVEPSAATLAGADLGGK